MKKVKPLGIIICAFCTLLTSCLGSETSVQTKNTSYHIQVPLAPWGPLSAEPLDADFAYQNTKTGSSFYVRSACNIYQDASLDQLTISLVRLFDHPKIIDSKPGTLAKRAAKTTTLTGEMDGVPVQVKITILKKNSCNFDFVYVSIPKFFQQDVTAYEKFVNSFNL